MLMPFSSDPFFMPGTYDNIGALPIPGLCLSFPHSVFLFQLFETEFSIYEHMILPVILTSNVKYR